MEMKTCTGCNKTFPATLDYFYREKRLKCGLTGRCKWCKKEYRDANSERLKELNRKWRLRNPEYAGNWMRKNTEKTKAADRRWRINHPDKVREKACRRRAQKRGVWVEKIDPGILWKRDKGICGICKKPIVGEFHIEHIIPISRHGEIINGKKIVSEHSYKNCQVAHPSCNLKKGNQLPYEIDWGGCCRWREKWFWLRGAAVVLVNTLLARR